jgi:polysaccharide export outer membrane protein
MHSQPSIQFFRLINLLGKPIVASVVLVTLTVTSVGISAQTIDPAMLAQIQSMPKAQQAALAKQYGIDLNSVNRTGTNTKTPLAQQGEPLQQRTHQGFINNDELANDQEALFNQWLMQQQTNQSQLDNDDTLPRYGMDLFNQDVSTFAPTDNAQVPSDYLLGVGDELVVQFYGKESQELVLEVNRDGQINMPRLGQINVSGLLFTDATALIKDKVANSLIGVNAVVTMGRLRVINVFMAGEVKIPGAYSVSALTTISQALFQARGLTDIGSLRDVQIKRQGKVVARFDVYDLLLRGNSHQDIRLHSGDVVFVPTYNALVEVSGEVKRPMLYELANNENITDAIGMAGGLKSSALNSQIVLVQRSTTNDLPQVVNIELDDPKQVSTRLVDGDKVKVLPLSDAVTNAVTIKGAVVRSGEYGWYKGVRVSDIISDIRRDLDITADLEYSIIVREKNTRLDIEVIQFSLVDALQNKGSEADPLLSMHDQIIVFDNVGITNLDEQKGVLESDIEKTISKSEASKTNNNPRTFDEDNKTLTENSREMLLTPIIEKLKKQAREGSPVQLVSVSGAVKSPGQYPINGQYTAEKLINAAGGFKDSAYLQSVELRRITEKENGSIEAQYQQYDVSNIAKLSSLTLQSRDNLNVRENVDWNPDDSIEISGEVRFPGTYLIRPGETIKEVLSRAGGLDTQAFVNGAIFTRQTIADLESERAKEFAQTVRRDYASSILTEEVNSTTFEEILAITTQLEKFEGQGRLLIDLNEALTGEDSANITLMDGDKLFVPKLSNTITIVGEVRRQGSHSFQQSLDINDYLALSAGLTKRADDAAMYIVKANGAVVIPNTSLTSFTQADANLQAGDTIVVPVDAQYKDSIPFWRDVTQIIYQGTVAIAAIASL